MVKRDHIVRPHFKELRRRQAASSVVLDGAIKSDCSTHLQCHRRDIVQGIADDVDKAHRHAKETRDTADI